MNKLKIVFAGTPLIADTILNRLIENRFDIKLVMTQSDKPSGRGKKLTSPLVKLTALNNRIEVVQPLKLKNNQKLFDHLKQISPDIMVVVAYGMIIPKEMLAIARLGCINIHVSLLPKHRGAAPIQRAIECGDDKTGITIMQMDEGLDTGDILMQKEIVLGIDETSKTLHDKLAVMGGDMIIEYLNNYSKYPPQKQPNIGISYANKITKDEAKINWSLSNVILERKIRAFNPYPICYSSLHNILIKIWRVGIANKKTNLSAGTIVNIERNYISVACGDGSILDIFEVQLAGKNRIKISEFLLGHKIKLGDIFI